MLVIVVVLHLRIVPASALAGAVFLIVSDIISRVIIPARCCPSASSAPWSERPLSPSSCCAATPPDEPRGTGRRLADPRAAHRCGREPHGAYGRAPRAGRPQRRRPVDPTAAARRHSPTAAGPSSPPP